MATKQELIDQALAHMKRAKWSPHQWAAAVQNGYPKGQRYAYEGTPNMLAQQALYDAVHAEEPAPPPPPPPAPPPTASSFQHLGGFVNTSGNCPESKIAAFAAAGGKWIVPLLAQLGYPDDHDPACVRNLANLDGFRGVCSKYGVAVGGWFNGWAGGELGTTADADADHVARIVHDRAIAGPVVLDLEAAYQYPIGEWNELPKLVGGVRARLPLPAEIGVSTNSPNDAMLWNGGPNPAASMFRLGVHLLPQWYNSPAYGQGTWMQPDQTMAWLNAHGASGNLHDPLGPGGRAIPLDWIHGTLEVTGVESADLAGELAHLKAAKASGYAYGLSLYVLERTSDSDLALCAAQRGALYL